MQLPLKIITCTNYILGNEIYSAVADEATESYGGHLAEFLLQNWIAMGNLKV